MPTDDCFGLIFSNPTTVSAADGTGDPVAALFLQAVTTPDFTRYAVRPQEGGPQDAKPPALLLLRATVTSAAHAIYDCARPRGLEPAVRDWNKQPRGAVLRWALAVVGTNVSANSVSFAKRPEPLVSTIRFLPKRKLHQLHSTRGRRAVLYPVRGGVVLELSGRVGTRFSLVRWPGFGSFGRGGFR